MAPGLVLTIATCWFCSLSLSAAATKTPPDQPPAAPQEPAAPVDVARLRFSVGLGDIVKMVKANVNPEVIKTFISHSSISYNPSAQEVIVLKRLGVSNEIIITLLGHRTAASESPQPSPRQMMRAPAVEEIPDLPLPRPPSSGGYPFHPYAVGAFPVFGSLTSFNNSYPTFVNGHSVFAGYYFQTYPVLW